MRRAHRIGVLVIGTVAVVVATGRVAVAQSKPSLAEVARQEAERRKALTTSARVYTNDDLKHARPLTTAAAAPAPVAGPVPAPGVVPEPAADAGTAAAPAASRAPGGGNAAAEVLAGRLLAARDALEQARAAFGAQQMRVTSLTADWVGAPDEASRATIARARDVAGADAERLRGEIDALTRTLAQLEQDVLKQVRAVPPTK